MSKVTHPEAVAIKSVDGLSAQVQKKLRLRQGEGRYEVKQFMGDRTF